LSPKCSIVIRAYNEEKHIGRLLEGIVGQTLQDVEIILVDSGSTDATREIAQKYPVKIVDIKPEDFTFGRSLNLGIQAAAGDLIVITSAHCYPVRADWLERLLAPLDEPAVGASYGRQRGGESNQFSEHQWFAQYFPGNSVERQGHPFLHNANAAIRKSLWEEHSYNENLTGLEDLAWGSWAMEEGHAIAYIADAEVIHLHDETLGQVYNRYRREAIAMRQILPQSRFNLRYFLSLSGRMIFSDIGAALRQGIFLRQLGSIVWFRLMQYWGTYQGYRYSGKVDAQLHRQFYYPPGILSEKTSAGQGASLLAYSKPEGKSDLGSKSAGQ